MNNARDLECDCDVTIPVTCCISSKGRARLCLTEARVPSFNGEKTDLKPAITSFYMYFYVIPFFSPLKIGTRASLRHVVCHHLKGYARLCLTEARVPSFNGEKADLKPTITSFYMYFYVIPFFSPLKSGTRASLRHESVTTLIQMLQIRSCMVSILPYVFEVGELKYKEGNGVTHNSGMI